MYTVKVHRKNRKTREFAVKDNARVFLIIGKALEENIGLEVIEGNALVYNHKVEGK